jgi:hypothetical protein
MARFELERLESVTMGSQNLTVLTKADNATNASQSHYIRTDARFLAHLVATRANTAQHRAKNRAAPETGAQAYRRSLALPLKATASQLGLSA